jgi:hypothetical protein
MRDADVPPVGRAPAPLPGFVEFCRLHLRGNPEWDFWSSRGEDFISTHVEAFTTAASADFFLRMVALKASLITTGAGPGQALRMPGGPVVLFRMSDGCFEPRSPYFIDVFTALLAGWPAFGQPRVASAAYLGAAAILLIVEETRLPQHIERRLGPLRHMAPYLARR